MSKIIVVIKADNITAAIRMVNNMCLSEYFVQFIVVGETINIVLKMFPNIMHSLKQQYPETEFVF